VADCNIGPAVCATRLRADDRLRFGVAGPGFALMIARASVRLRREAASARSRRSAP